MTRKELKHNFINGVMDLRNKGLVEQDSLLDLFEDVIEPCIADLEKENTELKKEVLEVRQHLDLTEREWGKDTVKLIHFKTQLAEAKKIIEKLYSHVFQGMGFMELNDYNAQKAEAERFLKENA